MAMATYLTNLNIPAQGMEGLTKQLHAGRKHITLKYVTDHWEVTDHTDAEPAPVSLGSVVTYTPPIVIRGVSIGSLVSTVLVLKYDTEFEGINFIGIEEPMACNVTHPQWIKKLYLSLTPAATDALEIHLKG
jgi:hypothetical protein